MQTMEKDMDFDAQSKLVGIRNWAEENRPDFDFTFLDSLDEAFEEYEELTEAQEQALDNIIEGFRIDIEEYQN